MRLLVDGRIFEFHPTGGISRMLLELLPRMCDLEPSLRARLVTSRPVAPALLPRHSSLTYAAIPQLPTYLRPWRVWHRVRPAAQRVVRRAILGSGRHSIWHSTYYTLPGAWRGRIVVSVYDMIHELFPSLFSGESNQRLRASKAAAIRRADAVICISETTRNDLLRLYGVNKENVHVVPLAASPEFRQMNVPASDSAYMLFVGDRNHYKNFLILLEAFEKWRAGQETRLYVVGGGPPAPEEEARIREAGVGERVRFLGRIDDRSLCRLYNGAVAYIQPSLYEGFGIPILEALACGCPVVASDIAASREVAGPCAIYFNPMEAADLIRALDLAVGRGRQSAQVVEGLQRVRSFSWDASARATLEVYRRVERSTTRSVLPFTR